MYYADWPIGRNACRVGRLRRRQRRLHSAAGSRLCPADLDLGVPACLRRASNVAVEHLLVAFALAWLGVVLVGPAFVRTTLPGAWPLWIGMCVVPLVAALVLLRRHRMAS